MGILILAIGLCALYLIYVSKIKKAETKVQEAPEKIEPLKAEEVVYVVEEPAKKAKKPAAKKPAAKKPVDKKPAAKKPAAKKTKAEIVKTKKAKK